MMSKAQIGLLDCNNFFVSCERLFRPDLVGKPVIVLSSNDGCVVARSQEVKDMNVPMGVPYFHIKDIIKKCGITTFSSHMSLYRDISRRVFDVMKAELDVVEQYSVDEAFFAVSGEPDRVAKEIKNLVETRVGIPVSVGVANNKTLAKYASKLAKKKAGVFCLTKTDWQEMNAEVKLSDIWGIGNKLALRFNQHKLVSVADFLALEPDRVAKLFGVHGVRLRSELAGLSSSLLKMKRELPQSIMSSRSFPKESLDQFVVKDAVAHHLSHTAEELRRSGLKAGTVRVSIKPSRHGDFVLKGGSKEARLVTPTNDTFELLKIANNLYLELYEENVPIKQVGVTLGNLSSETQIQAQLFDTKATESSAELMRSIDDISQRIGKGKVVLGSHLRKPEWQTRSASRSPAYTTSWSDIALVKSK